MKTMKKSIVLLIAVFLSVLSMASAQTNENQQRQRDIKIAEGIIAEIFGDQSSENLSFPGLRERNVLSEYIPGYGVHFTISPGLSNIVHVRSLRSNEEEIRVELQQNGNSSGSDFDQEEEIKEKIFEYMTKYASLISGLSDNETIRVTYAPNQSRSATWVFFENGDQKRRSQNGVSVWAKVFDLKQYRNGNISEQQLMNRISTHSLDGEETYTDFNIFASVLETALNSADVEHLRVSGKPRMEYLPGLGVRYRVQVSARPSVILNELQFLEGNIEFEMDSLRMNLDESLKMVEESLAPLVIKLDSMQEIDELSKEERERFQQELQEQRQEIQAHQNSLRSVNRPAVYGLRSTSNDSLDLSGEAEAIMDELLNVIENYGSTLTSLNDDEMLMISVSWSGRSDDLPERTEVRIKKSDLLNGEDPDVEEIKRR
ncbi:hypothetical protein [Rhodohalobacter sp. 614A]|uniref:hypothetical protein n=1 Tax=Rhodohalobacter sp. 614A TaxID=2908649 RepID=UPI001F3EED08|nr:hypothetical protein [Rhodohalobacter sp. 614A]